MWDIILNPFVSVLLLLYELVGQNVVLAIIAFTVLVRLLTWPLTVQQQRSSKAMQTLQPELKKIQEKYKGDREKLAQAQMELYREHGFNPMGGCLPLLIQLPILIGLYQAIIQALAATPLQLLDLSGRILLPGLERFVPMQNQFLWLNLAQPDPFYVLPILVLITTWLQQKLLMPSTPASSDDNQAAAMTRSMNTVMPIMFFFFSLSFASGLSIYFVVSNVIGIVQYAMMGKTDLRSLFRFGRAAQAQPAENPGLGTNKPATRKARTSKAK
jgi:YidC/Oxa1 family membrane protein insertase